MVKNNRGGVRDGCFICRYEKRKLLLIIRNYYIGKYCVTAKLYAIFIFPSQLTSRILYLGLFAKHIFCSNVSFIFVMNPAFFIAFRIAMFRRKFFETTDKLISDQTSSYWDSSFQNIACSRRQGHIVARYRRNFSIHVSKKGIHRRPYSPGESYRIPLCSVYTIHSIVRRSWCAHTNPRKRVAEPHRQKRLLTNPIKIMHFRAFANERCHFISTETSHVVRRSCQHRSPLIIIMDIENGYRRDAPCINVPALSHADKQICCDCVYERTVSNFSIFSFFIFYFRHSAR